MNNLEHKIYETIDEVKKYYEKEGIQIRSKITTKEEETDCVMKVKYNTKETIENITDTIFSYKIMSDFLEINIPIQKIIANKINSSRKIHNKQTINDAIIIYNKNIINILKKQEEKLKTVVAHELWHIIEHESGYPYSIISEGTATYAMRVYEKTENKLKNIIINNSLNQLKYNYCASIIYDYLNGSRDLKKLLEKKHRLKIKEIYKKEVLKNIPVILKNKLINDPLGFRAYIDEMLNLKDHNLNNIYTNNIFRELDGDDKEKIIKIYAYLEKKINKIK